jgi:hypothetical protein
MKFRNRLSIILTFFVAGLMAQNTRHCGTPNPGQAWDNWFNAQVQEFTKARVAGKVSSTTYVIPVIVHVIHGGQGIGTYPNLSQNQINSEIAVLNADYAGIGYGASTLPPVFSTLVANCNVSFCLAKFDPAGNCLQEAGIERINYHTIGGANNPAAAATSNSLMALMDNVIKPATIWDPSRYLNIWISDASFSSQILGYSSFPPGTGLPGLSGTGTATTDGVWVFANYFGNGGSALPPYNKGRTATHEIGHYLGLRHTWGDSNCGNDYCNDTPPSQQANFGCQSHPYNVGVCSGNTTGEMFQNFMDYSDDACLALFTPDQNTRIQTALTTSPYRKNLTASAASLCAVGAAAAPVVNFTVSENESCVDSLVYALNASTGNPCPNYLWSVTPASGYVFAPGSSASSPNPAIIFNIPGDYTLSLSATNASGSNSVDTFISITDCGNYTGLTNTSAFSGQISLVPNPSTGLFRILTKRPLKGVVGVSVYNSLGQKIYDHNYENAGVETMSIDLSSYAPGVYQVRLESGQEKLVKRLILSE